MAENPDKADARVKAKRAGRSRRIAGWIALTLGIALSVVCAVSYRTSIMLGPWERKEPGVINPYGKRDWFGHQPLYTRTTSYSISVVWGDVRMVAIETPPSTPPGVDVFPLSRVSRWWPLHPVAAGLLVAGGLLLVWGYRAGRVLAHACRICGYSLAGLETDAPCPECGKTPAA